MSYSGTTQINNVTGEEINRALLDLLQKINAVSGKLDKLAAEVARLQQANSPS
jgi:hypothetical protein